MKTRKWFFVLVVLGFFVDVASAGATPRPIKAWEKCMEKAEASVDQFVEGISAVEFAVQQQCGKPPVNESGSASGVGIRPYDLVRSKTWKKKFVRLTKGKYGAFVDRLTIASNTYLDGDWIVGEGQAPHLGGSDEAAFAINIKSGDVFGAILEDGNQFSSFGATWEKFPIFLQTWAKNKSQ